MSKAEWNEYIGQISYMFQSNALFDSLTVLENVSMPLKYTTKLKKKEIKEKAMARLEQTELADVFDKYPVGAFRRHAEAHRPGARPGHRPGHCAF